VQPTEIRAIKDGDHVICAAYKHIFNAAAKAAELRKAKGV
jgi:hypothetical protein